MQGTSTAPVGSTRAWRGAALLIGGALALGGGATLEAADHAEAPFASASPVADINDLYAWHDPSTNKLVTVLTVLPFNTSPLSDVLDDDILYTIHIDNTADNLADINVYIRFGQDSLGNWGMQVENLPGSDSAVVGPIESIVYVDQGRYVYAGLRDDPFFFDGTGFGDTLHTGDLSFDSTRDTFAGANVFAMVLEMDLAEALDGSDTLQTWATTGTRVN